MAIYVHDFREEINVKNYKVITPLFPTYEQTRAMMKAVAGCSVKAVRNMITAIQEQIRFGDEHCRNY